MQPTMVELTTVAHQAAHTLMSLLHKTDVTSFKVFVKSLNAYRTTYNWQPSMLAFVDLVCMLPWNQAYWAAHVAREFFPSAAEEVFRALLWHVYEFSNWDYTTSSMRALALAPAIHCPSDAAMPHAVHGAVSPHIVYH